MPRLSMVIIRTALIYLIFGFTLGALMLWNKGVPLHPTIWRLLPAHMEFMLLGWTLQLAIGVAYWILPRFRSQRRKPWLVWMSYILLNAGIWSVALGGFVGPAVWMLPVGRFIETAAVVSFVIHAWVRVKPISL